MKAMPGQAPSCLLENARTRKGVSPSRVRISVGCLQSADEGALDDELRTSLQALPPDQRLLVTCEGAFSYLARDYDLEEAYLWPVNAESQISPRRMGRLIERVKRDQVPAVFCETTVSDKAQREVARAAGSRFGGNFYVDSLSDRNGPAATLLDLQRHNVKLIQSGLSSNSDPMP